MNHSLDITTLRRLYLEGALTPERLMDDVLTRIETSDDSNAWIRVLTREELQPYLDRLHNLPRDLPLWGIPFAIKDNIDLAGIPTTAACPEYAYTPQRSATVVQRLLDAGAVPVGKTNLDQFATGLVGTRSPFGPGRNSFNPDYISGGSSSGSAIATANGSVSFALGTDTAGSGRVPAAFNNLVGLKPTKGRLSTTGVVPACRSLDCVSIFALSTADAEAVLAVAEGLDPEDPYSRLCPEPPVSLPQGALRIGIPRPEQLEFFGNAEAARLFDEMAARCAALGHAVQPIDFAPFLEAARLLYEGPWVAERYAAIQDFIETSPDALWPVTREIIAAGGTAGAVDAFKAQYRLAALKRRADEVLAGVDVVLTPTAGTLYTLAELEAEPVRLNTNLGRYTNFMNLLDYSAVAVPAGFQDDGLPFGVTLFAPAFADRALLALGDTLHRTANTGMGAARHALPDATPEADEGWVEVAVCGAHMSGLPLNHQLTERGGVLLSRTCTAPRYRFYALPGGPPARPGLVRMSQGGAAIAVEVWRLPLAHYGSFVAGIPAPLGIGRVQLEQGHSVQGFLCEAAAIEGAQEITDLADWRLYLAGEP